jgi:filamentous hemagglutinin
MGGSASIGGLSTDSLKCTRKYIQGGTSDGRNAGASSIVGANNVNIVATGGGETSNIRAVGSTIAAGNTVNLAADNQISLEASKNTYEHHGTNSSSGASIGVGFAAGSQNGFTIDLGVSKGRGKEDGSDVSYNNTHVSGGKQVNVVSGGDLNIKGAIIDAPRVDADVGGNLNIESLQDTSTQTSKQSSSGLNVSLCIPPICYGVSTVGGSAASAKANGDFASVKEQSGIKAGDGGFNVNVAGRTDLKGGVISSTQAAIDAGKNRFQTASLTSSDIQNHSTSKGSSYSVSGSVGFAAGDQSTATTDADKKAAANAQTNARPGGSAGVGSAGSTQTSTTKSGISGMAGDETVRAGDVTSTGALVKEWNTNTIMKDVQAQAHITAEFGSRAAGAWGQYANSKLVDALSKDDQAAAACWADGGSCRIAGHAVIGGLAGGGAGAAGAGLGAATVSDLGEAVGKLGLSGAAADTVTAGLAAAVGYAAGGISGAAGAFNEAANNYLSSGQVREMMGKLRAAPTQAERDRILKEYAALSTKQSDAIAGCAPAACEQIAADVQAGKQSLDAAKSELRTLAGDAPSAAYGSILGTQKSDQQFFFSLGNGWVDSSGMPLDVAKQMRAEGKAMADSVSKGAAYVAAGCAAFIVCAPATPVIGAVGLTAGLAKDWIFDLNPAASITDWGVDKSVKGIGDTLRIPAFITTPISENIKDSKELSDWKDSWSIKR